MPDQTGIGPDERASVITEFAAAAAVTLAVAGTTLGGAAVNEDAGAAASGSSAWNLRPTIAEKPDGVVHAQHVEIAWDVLANAGVGDRVDLPLFGDRVIAGLIERRDADGVHRFVLSGSLDNVAIGGFTLAVHGHGLAGIVRTDAETYRIRGSAGGAINLEALDESAIPWCDLDGGDDGLRGLERRAAEAGAAAPSGAGGCDDGQLIDLLVVFTVQARQAAGGTQNMLAEIDLMVSNMNDALAVSDVDTRMDLVYAREVDVSEALLNLGTLTGRNDGILDEVHALRTAYGADEVALVVSGGGGVANGLSNLNPQSEALAFCVNGRNSLPFIIAHEVGHNLGCCHARGDGGGCGIGLLYEFSNGHRFFGDSGTEWRGVMAYAPGVWSGFYSNPLLEFDGVVTGVPDGEPNSADNALTMNLSTPVVATWRTHDTTCSELDLDSDAADCDGNGIPDLCDIARGDLSDLNRDGIPDECFCPADFDGNGVVDVADLILLLAVFGEFNGPQDIDGNGVVDVIDLILLLSAWGSCVPEGGACCLDDGTCYLSTGTTCAAAQGVYGGTGTTCEALCPTGACCLPNGCVISRAEECDAAGGIYQGDGAICSCEGEPCGPVDDCGAAQILEDGTYAFSTQTASTDGPLLPPECYEGNGPLFLKDVWMSYRATCDGLATASVCDSSFDTRLAIYDAGGCGGSVIACSDDACGEGGTRSEVSFPVSAGQLYLVRVGGRAAVGEGTLVVSCE